MMKVSKLLVIPKSKVVSGQWWRSIIFIDNSPLTIHHSLFTAHYSPLTNSL